MKTYKNLIEIALSDEIMNEALESAIKQKSDRPQVQEVVNNSEEIKKYIRYVVNNGGFKPLIHKAHIINDGLNRKTRIIIPPYFTPKRPELWIEHIVIKTLQPIILKGMYEFSCGSIPGRGVHYGKKYLEKFIKNHPKQCKYVLKLDIRHFYENVNTGILKQRFARIIKDDKMLGLIYYLLDSNTGVLKSGQVITGGLPIGFYTSQWFANYFLSPFDHYIKEELKADFYMRYMDDIVITGSNKRQLRQKLLKIKSYLLKIGLNVKGNYQIFRFDYIDKNGHNQGRFIDFMGFKFYRDKTTIRKSIFMNASRLALDLSKKLYITPKEACSLLSYIGWFKPTNTKGAFKKFIIKRVSPVLLKNIVRENDKRKNRRLKNEIQNSSSERKAARNRYIFIPGRCILQPQY